ncbi:MAG: hypothetical protein V2I36_15985 [Desulfopila sp.]|jgi:hypothetical protein|nr:hypothetical protein [Desulfopila sp.]
MNTACHVCGKQLKLGSKMLESINALEPGKSIRVKCPACSNPIVLDTSIVRPVGKKPARKEKKVTSEQKVRPPAPPDISWLEEGVFDEEQVIEDVPLALILMDDSDSRDTVIESIESIGYKSEIVRSSQEAMEKMQFVEYSCVVLQSNYEGSDLASSTFHQYMCSMSMERRRFVFYILIGREFQTLYNLQALANSANLVVNEKEVPYFNVIIRKAIPEYEELFGLLMEELRVHGK